MSVADLISEEAVVLDGMDEAIIGVGWDHAKSTVLFYDRAILSRLCVERLGLARVEAEAWICQHVEPLCDGALVLVECD